MSAPVISTLADHDRWDAETPVAPEPAELVDFDWRTGFEFQAVAS